MAFWVKKGEVCALDYTVVLYYMPRVTRVS